MRTLYSIKISLDLNEQKSVLCLHSHSQTEKPTWRVNEWITSRREFRANGLASCKDTNRKYVPASQLINRAKCTESQSLWGFKRNISVKCLWCVDAQLVPTTIIPFCSSCFQNEFLTPCNGQQFAWLGKMSEREDMIWKYLPAKTWSLICCSHNDPVQWKTIYCP